MSPKASNGGDASPLAPASSPEAAGSCATPLSGAKPSKAHQAPINPTTNWSVVQLKTITQKIGSGSTPTGGSAAYLADRENFAFIRSQNVLDGSFDVAGLAFISDKQADGLKNVWLQPGDVLLNITGDGVTFARACLTPVDILPACVNQHVSIIRVDPQLAEPRFILAYLMAPSVKPYIESFNAGGSRRAITKANIESFEVPFPPISVQKAIAHILGTLDHKIELNRRINQTLEEMAQALFKSWFVDFDPVKAKASVLEAGGTPQHAEQAAMQSISGKSLEELESFKAAQPDAYAELTHTASLFPSRLTESELGPIPEGWEVIPFGSSLIHTIGGDWGKEAPEGKEFVRVRIFRGTDLSKVYLGDDSGVPTRYVDEKKLKNRRLQAGDLVIEVSGGSKDQSTGRSLLVSSEILSRFHDPVEPASFCRLFRPKSLVHGTYLDQHLRYIYRAGKMWGYQNQSTGISNFQTEVFLKEEPIIDLNEEILSCFNKNIQAMNSRINGRESLVLAECRDSLLPKLLSGELEIPDELLAEVSA